MKTRLVSSLLVLLTFFTGGCATRTTESAPGAPVLGKASPAARLLVISAVYGSGVRYTDVTYRVNDLLRQDGVEFYARPKWLDADPTPGWNKALVITYEYQGRRHTFTTGEGGGVSVRALIDHAKKQKRPSSGGGAS